MTVPAQLLAYRFPADAGFEGRLLGALERMQAGGALRVLDLLVVGSDATSGERFAIDVHTRGAGGIVAPLIGFRLNVEERRRATRHALAGERAQLIGAVGEALAPGDALVAVLVGHAWQRVLEDAVARTGGRTLTNTFMPGTSLLDMVPEVVRAAGTRLDATTTEGAHMGKRIAVADPGQEALSTPEHSNGGVTP